MKDNEEILITANEALRKELEELKTQVSRREKERPFTHLSYNGLMGVTVIGTAWMVFTTRELWPVFLGILLIGWLSDKVNNKVDDQSKAELHVGRVRVNISENRIAYEVEEKPEKRVRKSQAKRDA